MAFEKNRTARLTGGAVLNAIGQSGETLRDGFKKYEDTWKALFRRVEKSRDLYEFIPSVVALSEDNEVRPKSVQVPS